MEEIFFWLFWPLKLCLWEFVGQRLHCSRIPQAKEQGVQNSVVKEKGLHTPKGQICRQSLPRGVLEPLFFAPQSFGPLILCPAEFWSYATFAP